MDGGERAGEAGRDQVVENLRADLAALAVGADDHDRAWLEKSLHRRRGGGLRAERRLACEGRGHRQRDRDTADTRAPMVLSTAKPESRKTSSMRRLSPRTSAVNVSIPCARAIAASRSRSCVPMPWPCRASATAKATSAQFDACGVEVEAGKGNDVAVRFDDQGGAASRVRCGQPADSRRRERRQPEEAVIPAVD